MYNVSFSTPTAKPNSSTLSSATVTNSSSGATITNLSTISVVVLFPDGSTSTYTLAGGAIANAGGGIYNLSYNSKGPGLIRETWSMVGSDGTTLSDINNVWVSY